MLELQDIHTYYGKSHILQGVSLEVKKGQLVALLGRNGVGKTTTLKSIIGITPPKIKKGKILFEGEDITGEPSYKNAKKGIGYIPEDRRIFPGLTVYENLIFGFDLLFPGEKTKQRKQEQLRKINELFPELIGLRDHLGNEISGGQQQMLTIARVLITNPKFILLDEPTEGLMPTLAKELGDLILRIKDETATTCILVEQNAKLACKLCERGYVMEKGRIEFEGEASDLIEDEEVLSVLGVA